MCRCSFSSFASNRRHCVDASIVSKEFRLDKRFVSRHCDVHRTFYALSNFDRVFVDMLTTIKRHRRDEISSKVNKFSTSIFFHALRWRSIFRFISSMILIDIDIWLNDWLNFDLIMQCINFFYNFSNIKIKFMMLHKLRVFHMIVFDESVKRNWIWWTTFKNWFLASCCVDFAKSLHKEWCKLKSFKMMCFFSSFNCLLIVSMTDNVDIDAYELNETL
jgi:hypothetical protein